ASILPLHERSACRIADRGQLSARNRVERHVHEQNCRLAARRKAERDRISLGCGYAWRHAAVLARAGIRGASPWPLVRYPGVPDADASGRAAAAIAAWPGRIVLESDATVQHRAMPPGSVRRAYVSRPGGRLRKERRQRYQQG